MLLKDLLKKLSYSELSNMNIGTDGVGHIDEAEHEKIIIYINDGLNVLFTRYILRILVEPTTGLTTDLSEKYDLVKVIQIQDVFGKDYAIDGDYNYGFRVTPFNQIQYKGIIYNPDELIFYQALHDKLDMGSDYLNQIIRIPYFIEKPLQAFVASEIYKNMNNENTIAISQNHMNTFLELCNLIDSKGLAETDVHFENTKLYDRGFI